MPIQITCGACGRRLSAPDSAAGIRGKCPNCEEVLSIPGAQTLDLPPANLDSPDRQGIAVDGLTCRGRRWAQVFGGRITDIFFPPIFTLRNDCIETKRVGIFFLPWTSEVERMPFGKVASYRHLKGLIWDKLVIETTGGSKDLHILGLRKAHAKELIAALDKRLAITTHREK